MDHPARVRVLERLAERDPDARHVAVGDRARVHAARRGCGPDQLGHEVDLVLVGGQLVDGDDARVVQPGGRARLALDPLAAAPRSRGIALTATSRSSFSSQASQTTPKPPAPRRRSSR